MASLRAYEARIHSCHTAGARRIKGVHHAASRVSQRLEPVDRDSGGAESKMAPEMENVSGDRKWLRNEPGMMLRFC